MNWPMLYCQLLGGLVGLCIGAALMARDLGWRWVVYPLAVAAACVAAIAVIMP